MEIPKDEIMQKHIAVGMRNKENIAGFVVEVDEDYIKLIDYDNAIIYVNPSAIGYVKVGTPGNPAMRKTQLKPNTEIADSVAEERSAGFDSNERPDLVAIVRKPRETEFSMPISQPDQNPCGSVPTFERKTRRGD